MPRGPRLDAPGALHHVIARGIERRAIFRDDRDRRLCLDRLSHVISESRTRLYAWCFMPNHVHVLIRSGSVPIGRLMLRWLATYATGFNRRYRRAGHLFQNRFKSILVEEEAYLLELVRYIHLNPVRSRQRVGLDELDTYPWTGHAVLLGRRALSAQDTDFVLAHFGSQVGAARRGYREFLRAAPRLGARLDLSGGGLRRSLAGWQHLPTISRGRERWAHDERILGSSAFVRSTLAATAPAPRTVPNPAEFVTVLRDRVAHRYCVTPAEIASQSLRRRVLAARAVLCHLAVSRAGLSLSAVGRCLGISKQSVARAVVRAAPLLAADPVAIEKLFA